MQNKNNQNENIFPTLMNEIIKWENWKYIFNGKLKEKMHARMLNKYEG